MQIIIKHRTEFVDCEIKPHDRTQELTRFIKQQITIGPSLNPIDAPDWIQKDPTFNAMVDEGTLVPIQILKKPKEKTQPVSNTPSSGWGAKQQNIGLGFDKGN